MSEVQLPVLPEGERWRVVAQDGFIEADKPIYYLSIEKSVGRLGPRWDLTGESSHVERRDFGPKGRGYSNDWPSYVARNEANDRNRKDPEANWHVATNYDVRPGEEYFLRSTKICNEALIETAIRILDARRVKQARKDEKAEWVGAYPPKSLTPKQKRG